MSPQLTAFLALALAILSEVIGSAFMQKSEQYTKLIPTIAMAACFASSFYFLSQALKFIPLGVAYAIWAGTGIVLTALVSVFIFKMTLDAWAIVGIGFIVTGVIIMNTLSRSLGH